MDCNRCGHRNMPDARYCNHCGAPIEIQQIPQKNGQTPVPLVVILILVIACLVSIIGGYIYMRGGIFVKREIVPTPVPTEKVVGGNENEEQTATFIHTPTPEPALTPTPVPEESNTYQESVSSSKRQSFLAKAGQIEMYAEKYLETAMTQVDINIESGVVYQKWDDLLNEVYQYLKSTMPKADFEMLKADEMNWVYEKEGAMELEASYWEGGSGESMAWNTVGINYTSERCYYLISLVE